MGKVDVGYVDVTHMHKKKGHSHKHRKPKNHEHLELEEKQTTEPRVTNGPRDLDTEYNQQIKLA